MNGESQVPGADPEGSAPPTSTPSSRAGVDWRGALSSVVAGAAIGAAALALLLPTMRAVQAPHPAVPAVAAMQRQLDLGTQAVSADVRALAEAVVRRGDNGRLPFVMIDKREAQLLVFEASGRLLGATPILLGYAPGDDSVAGIGQRPIEQVQPSERTTPAGRFVAEPGRNTRGEEVIWVDYDAAVSMHRVRLTDPKERRLERLASPRAADRRISYGCINLPVAFFDTLLWPTLRAKGGVVYVLPEFKQMAEAFPQLLPAARVERQARLEPLI
jgi:hypothetical protein